MFGPYFIVAFVLNVLLSYVVAHLCGIYDVSILWGVLVVAPMGFISGRLAANLDIDWHKKGR